jgi:hypothetical protein
VRRMLCLALVLPFAVVSAHAATGRATVTGQGAQCPAQYVGRTATGFVKGMTHANCTSAKNIARANLRARCRRVAAPTLKASLAVRRPDGCSFVVNTMTGRLACRGV